MNIERIKKFLNRCIAGVMIVIVLCFSIPEYVYAWRFPWEDYSDIEEPEIILTELEEMPEPTEEPAKGYLGIKVAQDAVKSSDGGVQYTWQETYLPVVTDQEQIVYGKLDSLTSLLECPLYISGKTAKVIKGHSSIYLTLGTPLICYETDFFRVTANLGAAPIYHEEQWYVPLDAFLELTDSYHVFSGTTTAETEQLIVVPSKYTVLDRLAEYVPFRNTKYRFDFGKELGYSDDQKSVMKGSTLLIQLINRLATLDPETWVASAATYFGLDDEALNLVSKDYINLFTDYMLMIDESQASKTLAQNENYCEVSGCIFESIFNATEKPLLESIEATEALLNKNPPNLKLLDTNSLNIRNAVAKFDLSATSAVNNILTILGFVNSYLSLSHKLANGNNWMMESGESFIEQVDKLPNAVTDDFMQSTIKERIRSYKNHGKSLNDQAAWLADNWANVTMKGMAFLEVSYFGLLTFAADLWKVGTDFFYGTYIDAAELELAAVYGELYQTDAMNITDMILKESFQSYRSSWTADDEKLLRMTLTNEIKAQYVTRSLAISAEEDTKLNYYPQAKARMNSICDELSQYLVDFSDTSLCFGIMPQEMKDLGKMNDLYYPNVIFNIAEITGQILELGTEKPAKNVKMEIYDIDGTLIYEGKTDEEGMFDISLELEAVDSMDRDDAALRTLNVHLFYKNDPVLIEVLEIKCFHKYEVEGFRVGERTKDRLVYLREAKEEDGKTVLVVQEIDLGEKPYAIDMPGYDYTMYSALHNDMTLSNRKGYVLRDRVTLGSIYSEMTPENGLLDNILYLTDNIFGQYPEELTWREMQSAGEINQFIEVYRQFTQDDPVYKLTTVNSDVKAVKPAYVTPQ